MAQFDDAWLEHQRRRFQRPDGDRYFGGNADRFLGPNLKLLMHPDAYDRWHRKYKGGPPESAPVVHAPHADMTPAELESYRSELFKAKAFVAELKWQLALRRFARKYSPDQPRVPAGSPDGGQWTHVGGDVGGQPLVEEDNELEQLFEAELDDELQARVELVALRNRARGHHYVPEGIFNKYPLPDETRRVFENARTVPIPDAAANYFDQQHRTYNKAVDELFQRFVDRNKIDVERMTPAQALDFLRETIRSRDPRIRDVNTRIWRSILRGRGND